MAKTQSSSIRLLMVLLGIGLVGCRGVHSLRGDGGTGSTCFNFTTPSPTLVLQRIAVSSSPLDRSSSPVGRARAGGWKLTSWRRRLTQPVR